jgi:hypothetical protein
VKGAMRNKAMDEGEGEEEEEIVQGSMRWWG